jgi:hypothetical protein
MTCAPSTRSRAITNGPGAVGGLMSSKGRAKSQSNVLSITLNPKPLHSQIVLENPQTDVASYLGLTKVSCMCGILYNYRV